LRSLHANYTVGFSAYSDGTNDDVNKIVWSATAWNSSSLVSEVVGQYSKYFISSDMEQQFAGEGMD
jgi:hypothetical protein